MNWIHENSSLLKNAFWCAQFMFDLIVITYISSHHKQLSAFFGNLFGNAHTLEKQGLEYVHDKVVDIEDKIKEAVSKKVASIHARIDSVENKIAVGIKREEVKIVDAATGVVNDVKQTVSEVETKIHTEAYNVSEQAQADVAKAETDIKEDVSHVKEAVQTAQTQVVNFAEEEAKKANL